MQNITCILLNLLVFSSISAQNYFDELLDLIDPNPAEYDTLIKHIKKQRQQLASTQYNTRKKVADHHQSGIEEENDDEDSKSSKKWRKSSNTRRPKKKRKHTNKKCIQDEDCNDSFFQLCTAGHCTAQNCSSDSDCPSRSKCHSQANLCRNLLCQSVKDCFQGELCQDKRCVVSPGKPCRHHIHCQYQEVCQNKKCTKKFCRFDDQCNDQRLSCHSQGFCTVQLDYVEGRRLSRAHVKNKQRGLIEEAESIEEKEPNLSQAQEEELERQVNQSLERVMAQLPSHQQLKRTAEKQLEAMDHRTLQMGRKRILRRIRKPLRRKVFKCKISTNMYEKLTFSSSTDIKGRKQRRPNNRRRRKRRQQPKKLRDRFDNIRIQGGIPELAALGDYGDALQTVSEQIIAHTRLSPKKAISALGRKKHQNCRWKNPVVRDLLEYHPGCLNKTFGDPRFVRLHSGACNNLTPGRQHWGLMGLPLTRLQPADYSDGVNQFRVSRATGEPLPNPRVISNRIAWALGHKLNNNKPPDDLTNVNFVFFAQFVDHDFGNTFPKPINNNTPVFGALGNPINCCGPADNRFIETYLPITKATRKWCISIKIPDSDPYWSKRPPATRKQCLHQQVTRAVPDFECHLGPRQILNQVSNFLDLSQIYNSKRSYFDAVNRDLSDRAKLILDNQDEGKGFMPRCPTTSRPRNAPPISCSTCLLSGSRTPNTQRNACFIGGDFRTDENVALAAHQTLWLREHNRLVGILRQLRPGWSAEKLFQEARRINIAQYQHILFNEFLPLLVGRKLMKSMKLWSKRFGYNRQYDPTVNPSIQNVFATAAFRFGHGMLPDSVPLINENNGTIVTWDINDIAFQFPFFNQAGFPTSLFRGMMRAKAGKASGFFAKKARDALNPSPNTFGPATNIGGFDLLAWNINRGRDHGLPPYHTWLMLTSKKRPKSWSFFVRQFERGNITTHTLQTMYKSWKDIDFYLGGLLEKVPRDRFGLRSQVLGPTYAKLIASQFARLRRGDRFFYEDNSDPNVKFTRLELKEIKKVTFAQIMCKNLSKQSSPLFVLRYPFLQENLGQSITRQRKRNTYVNCDVLLNEPRAKQNWGVYQGLPNIV